MKDDDQQALQVTRCIPGGGGLSQALLRRASELVLDLGARQQRSFEAVDSAGRTLRIEQPEGQVLHGGDVLVAADGSLVRVTAAEPESEARTEAAPAPGRRVGIPVVGQAAPHVHGPGCGHAHGHDHPGHGQDPEHGHPQRGH
jgi:hypothetical protein